MKVSSISLTEGTAAIKITKNNKYLIAAAYYWYDDNE